MFNGPLWSIQSPVKKEALLALAALAFIASVVLIGPKRRIRAAGVSKALWCVATVAFLAWTALSPHEDMSNRFSLVDEVFSLICLATFPAGTFVFAIYLAAGVSQSEAGLYGRGELAILGTAMSAAGYYQWFKIVPRIAAWFGGRR